MFVYLFIYSFIHSFLSGAYIAGDTGDRAVAGGRADTGPGLVDAVDPQLLEGGVGGHRRDGGQEAGENGGGLHRE